MAQRTLTAGTAEELLEKLAWLPTDSKRPIAFMFGAGVSASVLPSTAEMAELFLQALRPVARDRTRLEADKRGGAAAVYQAAARAVTLQRDDETLHGIIKESVLGAFSGIASQQDITLQLDDWRIPEAYRQFAQYYRKLPGALRGPIVTTNFDPFIEIALRREGIQAAPRSVVNEVPPAIDDLRLAAQVPVVHLHGYFDSKTSINTVGQLQKERASVQAFLQQLLQSTTIIVLGYGGWNDEFTRTLRDVGGYAALTNAQIVWCAHEKNEEHVLLNDTLASLDGRPGFQLFVGIESEGLFNVAIEAQQTPSFTVPRGHTALPAVSTSRSPEHFVNGEQPEWQDAEDGRWPRLGSTRELLHYARQMVQGTAPGAIAAVGPTGEGKSLGLRQVAAAIAGEFPSLKVIWREPGAPLLDRASLRALSDNADVLLVIDDADTAMTQFQLIRELQSQNVMIHLLVGCHERFWGPVYGALGSQARQITFSGLNMEDSLAIARRWRDFDLLPTSHSHGPEAVEGLSNRLLAAANRSRAIDGSSLFGAVLEVRQGNALKGRVASLMTELDRTLLKDSRSLTLADALAVICVQQEYLDSNRDNTHGATQDFLAEFCGSSNGNLHDAVLTSLGREAAISLVGQFIFARHPMIARAVVNWLIGQDRLSSTMEMIGEIGGRLRVLEKITVNDRDSYMLGREVDQFDLAKAAFRGTLRGAPYLLEPRITFIAAARRAGQVELALRFGEGSVSNMHIYTDRAKNIGVFCTELSRVLASEKQYRAATGLAALALHTGAARLQGGMKLRKAFIPLLDALRGSRQQGDVMAESALETAARLSQSLLGADFVRAGDMPSVVQTPKQSLEKQAAAAASALTPYAAEAIRRFGLPFGAEAARDWLVPYQNGLRYLVKDFVNR